ncbi:MAG: hypothetical protein A2201_04125 [Alicyclobacillus sp. RIFOXYA1_FULL_53_8]|nr:MAG: hypothetical protein A2201_04125 [Alicyclobacillus sp. RIFOXYA1_FULL_53_8]
MWGQIAVDRQTAWTQTSVTGEGGMSALMGQFGADFTQRRASNLGGTAGKSALVLNKDGGFFIFF